MQYAHTTHGRVRLNPQSRSVSVPGPDGGNREDHDRRIGSWFLLCALMRTAYDSLLGVLLGGASRLGVLLWCLTIGVLLWCLASRWPFADLCARARFPQTTRSFASTTSFS